MSTANYFVAFATFFATVGVADIALIFAALTRDSGARQRFVMATRGVLVAGAILVFFALAGNTILDLFGVTIPALRVAGGILLLLIAIDMVFARHSGGVGTTSEEEEEGRARDDISVFPLAMPLLAGPGAISAVVLLTTGARTDLQYWTVVAALVSVLALAWLTLLVAIPIQRLLGLTGLSVVSRVVGILLTALAVQFVFDGIRESGILVG
ncbi:MarC family protein [Pelagibacterium montanilacus]|uniref:MarC family protein n=1 Tax=Pelagibacterium montanilacus TaxID=2185280 RepID=UPI000F8CC7D8|nr:MarC family protein [Pelagibacterium montanilacus]